MSLTEQKQPETDSRQRLLVVLGAVVIGYAVVAADALSRDTFPYSPLRLAAILVVGLLFTVFLVKEEDFLGQEPTSARMAVYFLGMLGLLILNFLLVETVNGIWLVAMPFIGTGVAILPRIWGWLLATAVFLSMLAPVAIQNSLDEAFAIGVSLAPAIIFVIVFVRLWINAEEARQRTQKLADQLEAANQQLTIYLAQAEELATTKERNRLAREIHDSLGHYLTVINVQIEAARTIMGQNPEQASDSLKKAQALTQEGLASVRQSVAALRESPLSNRPLSTAIEALADEARNSGLVMEFEVMGEIRPLEPNAELTIYRAVQEGLTNVRKHARASRVDLTLDYQGADEVCLSIKDNGVGASDTNSGGFGLLGVRERVKLLGGNMSLNTNPGDGFEVRVVLPS